MEPQPGSGYEVPTTSPASFMSTPNAAVDTKSTTYELTANLAMLAE